MKDSRLFPRGAAALLVVFFLALPLRAQNSAGPQPAPLPTPIAAPVDTPYPGTLSLLVDLTNVNDRVMDVHETIPVNGPTLTLLYPEWIPGNHSPTGPISKISGLVVTAQGKTIPWVRDRVDVYAFHVDVPPNVKTLDVNFQYLAPVRAREGRISFSSKIADLSWNTVILYPAGYFSRDIAIVPSIRLPEGWKFATALEVDSQQGDLLHFKQTTLNTLVDSPLYAGVNYRREDLSTGPDNRVYLDVFADTPAELAITPEELHFHRNMVMEAAKLFASHHYDHYDFLFSLSDTIGGEGLEHHQSSEDGTRGNYFTEWNKGVANLDLLAHEYTHSWNGKFRRPAGLWTPNFNVPMQDDLLWVYEGLTQYYGYVLTARSGMRTAEETHDLIANVAANFEASPGRLWRPLVDTTNQPTISQRSPVSWVSDQRGEDYYMEGLLIWLDADTKIRELSGGTKSLDDFAGSFAESKTAASSQDIHLRGHRDRAQCRAAVRLDHIPALTRLRFASAGSRRWIHPGRLPVDLQRYPTRLGEAGGQHCRDAASPLRSGSALPATANLVRCGGIAWLIKQVSPPTCR